MPTCLVNENFRQELLENCGGDVRINFCCCGNPKNDMGTLIEVGIDFVALALENNRTVFIPLNRIVSFEEITPPILPVNCSSTRNFRTAIDDLCGQTVHLSYCFCNHSQNEVGDINEIGTDFVELAEPSRDIVVFFCSICRVEGPFATAAAALKHKTDTDVAAKTDIKGDEEVDKKVESSDYPSGQKPFIKRKKK